jgi:hypothetical protein
MALLRVTVLLAVFVAPLFIWKEVTAGATSAIASLAKDDSPSLLLS